MSFNDFRKLNHFSKVFVLQKFAEFMLFSLILKFTVLTIYIFNLKHADKFLTRENIASIVTIDFIIPSVVSPIIYIVTGYPIGTYIILYTIRLLFPVVFSGYFPIVSCIVTMLYALTWIHILTFDYDLEIIEYPLVVTLIASIFVYVSTRLIDNRLKC